MNGISITETTLAYVLRRKFETCSSCGILNSL